VTSVNAEERRRTRSSTRAPVATSSAPSCASSDVASAAAKPDHNGTIDRPTGLPFLLTPDIDL